MSEQESRAEEVARVRSYLTSQAAKRTPAQMVETLKEAQQQFVTTTMAIPAALFHTSPQPGEWSAAQVLAHVLDIAAFDVQTIVQLLETGAGGKDWAVGGWKTHHDTPRDEGLTELADLREKLIAAALTADPDAHLDVTWKHPEFGELHWREALLFARVHTLDHARQLASIAEHFAKASSGE